MRAFEQHILLVTSFSKSFSIKSFAALSPLFNVNFKRVKSGSLPMIFYPVSFLYLAINGWTPVRHSYKTTPKLQRSTFSLKWVWIVWIGIYCWGTCIRFLKLSLGIYKKNTLFMWALNFCCHLVLICIPLRHLNRSVRVWLHRLSKVYF